MFNSDLMEYKHFEIVVNIKKKTCEISFKIHFLTFLENVDVLMTVPAFLFGNNQLELSSGCLL